MEITEEDIDNMAHVFRRFVATTLRQRNANLDVGEMDLKAWRRGVRLLLGTCLRRRSFDGSI